MTFFKTRLFRSIVLLITSIAILVAGVLLPDLLISHNMDNHIDNVEYIKKDDLHPYGENFFEIERKLTTLIASYKDIFYEYDSDESIVDELVILDGMVYPASEFDAETYFMVWDYDDAIGSVQNSFNVGYADLLKFANSWNSDIYEDILPANIMNRTIYEGEGWTICSISFYNQNNDHNGMIAFDAETGLPIDIRISVRNTSTLWIRLLWYSLITAFSETSGMEFTSPHSIIHDFGPDYDSSNQAYNYDSSITINSYSTPSEGVGYFIHFYLK